MSANPNNPKPKKSSKAITRTGRWKKIFLKAIAQGGSIMRACELAHIHYTTFRAHREDADFKHDFEIALEQYDDNLESELHRRGVEGWLEPVFGSGGKDVGTVQVGTIRKFSDACLIVRLKARMPAKYKDHAQVTQTNQNNTLVLSWDEFLKMTQEDLPPKQIGVETNGQKNGQTHGPSEPPASS